VEIPEDRGLYGVFTHGVVQMVRLGFCVYDEKEEGAWGEHATLLPEEGRLEA
jgi:hypothetical protein